MFGLKPQRDRVSRAPDDRDGGHWVVFGALTRSVLETGVILDVLGSQERGETAFVDVEGGELIAVYVRSARSGPRRESRSDSPLAITFVR